MDKAHTEFQIPVEKALDFTRETYRHLHQFPELSFQEHDTSRYIQEKLTEMNVPFRAGIAGTGVLGRIEGRNPRKRIIALRADMDALPIQETTSLAFASCHANVMHAFGHDAHTACLLGAANILNSIKNDFEGTILLIFQPGEEKSPGGANVMLQEKIFENIQPELIIAQHVSVDYNTGEMGFLSGKIMASADEIHVTVRGKGGHGALPHLCNDTVLAASQIVVSLQQVKSRLCPPFIPMTLTFGKLTANGATNVIPDEVTLSGTFRTLDEDWRAQAKTHIQRIIHETCAAYGCTAEIEMPEGFPCVVNNEEVTEKAKGFAAEFAGKESIKELAVRMTSEDFGFFSQKYPSCFYRFGIKGADNQATGGLHTATFRIDEEALKTGAGGLAWIAYRFMTE